MSIPPFLLQASELGIRLEIVNGLPIWEAQPVYRHQKHVVVFDPLTLLVLHVRKDETTRQVSPVTVDLECGCRALV